MAKKIITVLGATGAQGGGLVRAIQSDPSGAFQARALTRHADSDKARALAATGAEVIQGDVDDATSLARAFDGAHGAFCITFYWDHFSPEKELAQVATMARLAKSAGLRHVVWSTLEDTRRRVPVGSGRMPVLMGKYNVPHFDAKGESDGQFVAQGVPTTFLLTSFYWDNFIHFGMGPKKGPDGVLALTLPMGDARLPGIAAEDIGRCAYGVFKAGEIYVGQHVGIAGGMPTGAEMAATMTRVLGREVRYNPVAPEVYRGFGFPGADDLGNMFQYKHDFEREFCGARDLALSKRLNPELQDFDTWLARNKERIPLD